MNKVVSVKCLFCEKYGKEEEDKGADAKGQKQKGTTNVKYFLKPWRSDNLSSHMRKQHKIRYEEFLASCQKR
jgi:hypothetical protein